MKQSAILIILITILFCLLGCNKPANEQFNINSIKTYRDIPGVTENEIFSIEILKKSRTSLSFGQMLETEAFILPDGTYAGFAVKLCNLLSSLFDIEFNLDLYDWEELIDGLDSKRIDFTGDLTPTPDRMRHYFMTHPIAERSLRVFMLAEHSELFNEKDINDLRIGSLTGTIDIDHVKHYYPELVFKIVDADSFDAAANMLKEGKIDIFITEGVIDPLFDKYGFVKSKEFFPLVYTPVSLTTANPDMKAIISVVNKYITAGGVDTLFEFYKKGSEEYSRYKLSKSFTEEEKAYINNLLIHNNTVKVALEHDNYPVSFYNKADKEFQGIAVDVLSGVANLTDLKFEFAHTEKSTWAEVFEMLRKGEVSIVSQLIKTEERKGKFLWPDNPYASTYYALISRINYPNLAIYQVVRTKVGVVSDSAYEEKYREWLPENDNIIGYDTQNNALNALEAGDIDLLMGSEHLLLAQQNYREKQGYKVNIRFGMLTDSYFGVNVNEEILNSIITKSQSFINTGLITDNWKSLGFDYTRQMAYQRALYFGLIAFGSVAMLLLTGLLLLKNRRLNSNLDKTVKERTKKLEAQTIELERQTQAAQAAAKAKGTFLATMSHEIRTPLNAIIGMTNIVRKSIADPDKALSLTNQILTSSHHLLGILNDVLDMSRIESGKLELAHKPFRLLEGYRELVGIIEHRCLEKNIRFITNIDELKDITLIGDKLRGNQALVNLLGNAVKFTPEGGEITLNIKVIEENDKNVKLHFSVSDTGIGIAEDQLSKLFIPFEQADSKVSASFGGIGLGLAISQYVISTMGSEIKVESKVGVGSKFYFELLFEKGGESDKTTGEAEILDLTGIRILVTEDIEINRLVIHELLLPSGALIEDAENGLIAVEMFSNSSLGYYDLIFMDIQMPIMDGYEATRQIRSLERMDAKDIPIIAISANAYKEDIDMCFEAGMNDHLAKPIELDVMIKKIAQYYNLKK